MTLATGQLPFIGNRRSTYTCIVVIVDMTDMAVTVYSQLEWMMKL